MNSSQRVDVLPHPPETRAPAHDGGLDEDGDPPVASRTVEVIELLDGARCYPCQRTQRACHVKSSQYPCLECSGPSALDCIFVRKIIREARPNFFTFEEIAGSKQSSARTWTGHLENGYPPGAAPPSQPSQPRNTTSSQLALLHHGIPEKTHPEHLWPPTAYHTQPPIHHAAFPPPKRQRTDPYDSRDMLNETYSRLAQPQLTQAPPELVSPRRTEFHLPEIRPSQTTISEPRPQSLDLRHELLPPSQAPLPLERKLVERTALDLKPPAPTSIKRKLETEISPSTSTDSVVHVQRCSRCDMSFKTPAELKKHFARHEPQYFCDILGCSRVRDGFTTKNDLDRHKKTMHKIHSPNDRFWKCFYPDCAKIEKVWPRLDNFKAHIVRMHGSQYVNDYTKRAEEWWDNQKVVSLKQSPELTTTDLADTIPNGTTERLLAPAPPNMHLPAPEIHAIRKRHLSAEGRQEAAQVREMGACLRCSLLKEKCDDSQLCHRCESYSKRHPHGELVCRRGNLSDFLVPLIPYISLLPAPDEQNKGWHLTLTSPQLRVTKLSHFFEPSFRSVLASPHVTVRRNDLTISLFHCIDNCIDQTGVEAASQEPLDRLRDMREVCCLLFDCILDAASVVNEAASSELKHDLHEKLQRTNANIRHWYASFDHTVFCWKDRQLGLDHSPWDCWLLFFFICSMLLTERLTASLTTTWAYLQGESVDAPGQDEAASTMCALLDLKFVRQTSSQYHFVRILLEDTQNVATEDIRQQIKFLDGTKNYDTWDQLMKCFGHDSENISRNASVTPVEPKTSARKNRSANSQESPTTEAAPDVVRTSGESRTREMNLVDAPNTDRNGRSSTSDAHATCSTRCSKCQSELSLNASDDHGISSGTDCEHNLCGGCKQQNAEAGGVKSEDQNASVMAKTNGSLEGGEKQAQSSSNEDSPLSSPTVE